MPEQLLTGNVGEWSEVYAFFHLMGTNELVPCDSNLQSLPDNHLPVIAIYRGEGPNGKIAYVYKDENGGTWEIHLNDLVCGSVPAADGKAEATFLLESLLASIRQQKKNNLQFPKAQKFLERLCDCRLKAKATDKEDIALRIQDIRAGQAVTCGFSIKSYLGSEPTLLNASGDGTNILYRIDNITSDQVKEVEAAVEADPRHKLQVLMRELRAQGATFTCCGLLNPQFEKNLLFIDTAMPLLIGELLLMHYCSNEKSVSLVTELVAENDPLRFGDKELYRYKVKKFLEAVALGLTPSAKNWNGAEDATGGFLIVKPDGELVTYHLYNRQALDEYLLLYTKFERPSTTRHKYGFLHTEEDGHLYLKLALQVRFCRPDKN